MLFRRRDSFLFIGKLHRQTQSAVHSRTPTTERMRFGARTPECLGTRPRTPPERTGKSSQAVRRDSAATSPRGHACSRESALPLAPAMPRSATSVPCTPNPIDPALRKRTEGKPERRRLPTQTRTAAQPIVQRYVLTYAYRMHTPSGTTSAGALAARLACERPLLHSSSRHRTAWPIEHRTARRHGACRCRSSLHAPR